MSSPDHNASAALSASPERGRLALASRGDALTPYLFDALRRRYPSIDVIDAELSAFQRYRVAAVTVRPTRHEWVERFYKSSYAARLRSANAQRDLGSLPRRPDVVFQVHSLFTVRHTQSILYLDCTHAQSAALWPAWNPLRGRALSAWYRRERENYVSAQHLFTFSEPTRASLVDDYGIDPEKVTVTGAGVNFSTLPVPQRGARNGHAPPTILFIGHDFVRKGGAVLLEAFSLVRELVPDVRLQLVGADPRIASQPGIEVLGRIDDRSLIAELYSAASVFVVPSLFDPYPLVALEAMAFGLPVITTKQMGTPEMISDNVNGRLVEPGSVVGLATALIHLLLNPDEAARLGTAARSEIARAFTWDAVVERMAPTLEQLIPGARR